MFNNFKKWSIWGLCFLILMTFVPKSTAQDFFPIISYSCPSDGGGRNYHAYFPQVQADGFNTIYQTHFDDTEFNTAQALGLRLISALYYRYCEGQQSFYEADFHSIFGEEGVEYFSHTNVIGQEILDEWQPGSGTGAQNDYAWLAQESVHSAGYMQRDLLPQFNREQNVLRPGDDFFDPHTFFADFLMRIPAGTVMPPRRFDIVRLEVVLNNENVTDLVLAARDITSGEFQDSAAVGDAYRAFRLTFQLTSAQEEAMSLAGHGLDYRVYWYNETDVYLDRVRLRDNHFETLITGGYDAELTTAINNFNTYFPNTLLRWYLRDEPHLDMYLANQYVTNFLRAFPGGTAEGIQATSGDISRLDHFMATIQPNEQTMSFEDYFRKLYNNPFKGEIKNEKGTDLVDYFSAGFTGFQPEF